MERNVVYGKIIELEEEKLRLYKRNSDLVNDSGYHLLMTVLAYYEASFATQLDVKIKIM
jgi:hypothetical protein